MDGWRAGAIIARVVWSRRIVTTLPLAELFESLNRTPELDIEITSIQDILPTGHMILIRCRVWHLIREAKGLSKSTSCDTITRWPEKKKKKQKETSTCAWHLAAQEGHFTGQVSSCYTTSVESGVNETSTCFVPSTL